MTFTRSTDPYLVRASDSVLTAGLPWTVLTLLAGWWGLPWGPIKTITSVHRNLTGGIDLTDHYRSSLERHFQA
ncbi:hypothetical protein [Lichenihabitans psoromatis]|uniref:hypothetical protein n=1 Tax=Lichenihabitans psoromatis TaxID=2528642 RepID=UPI001035F30F|nr:hypothetical protein [Lichenihabitans psoromatis]